MATDTHRRRAEPPQFVELMEQCVPVFQHLARRVMHPVYKKYVSRSKKYAAHDDANRYRTGDTVRIEESRPISKRKSWIVIGGPADAAPGRRHAAPATAAEAIAAEEAGSAA